MNFLPRLALKRNPPDLCSRWGYRTEPLHPAQTVFFSIILSTLSQKNFIRNVCTLGTGSEREVAVLPSFTPRTRTALNSVLNVKFYYQC
jgi:hypothetical protein